MNDSNDFSISIVFDNKCVNEGFLSGFGFSALLHNHLSDNYLLFDTGGNGDVLVHNIKQVGVDPNMIEKVIISHNHHDHMGGLTGFYAQNQNIELYIPDNFNHYERNFPLAQVHLSRQVKEIDDSVFISGPIGNSIREEALFCENKEGNYIILVGCTHPGLENFIMMARKRGKIEAVIGGFHGFHKYSYLEGINFIGACHCTSHVSEIRNRFPNHYKKVCVGDTFSF
jgi:7,8-dihydropterin-6-yl-methyl-4-(beta-D-ribofuranosyl)aminobenzene 5'-phosphate synthase